MYSQHFPTISESSEFIVSKNLMNSALVFSHDSSGRGAEVSGDKEACAKLAEIAKPEFKAPSWTVAMANLVGSDL